MVAGERTPLQVVKVGSTTPTQVRQGGPSVHEGMQAVAAEAAAQRRRRAVRLTLCVIASTFTAAANSVLFKRMVNSFKSDDPNNPHDYEQFINVWNVILYLVLAGAVVIQRRIKYGAHWWSKQDVPINVLCFMGFLDSTGSLLSTVGGAYVAGAIQNLLNQVIIPMTLALSFLFLGQTYTLAQTFGALIIFIGAAVAVLPWLMASKKGEPQEDVKQMPPTTTVAGVVLFLCSIVPGAFSNVYKEWGFGKYHVDLYYLTTCVTSIQVLFGFAFLPLLQFPAFGGVLLSQIPLLFVRGFKCFLGENSLPGDDCDDGTYTTLGYVLINFFFNVLQLLITKHGGATMLVISAALALPITNFAFKMKWIMGDDAEPFSVSDVVALAIVLAGFLMYSLLDDLVDHVRKKDRAKRLPIQFAAGSVIYIRERSNSDPSTPGYTPIRFQPPKRRGSMETQFGGGLSSSGSRAAQPRPNRGEASPAITIRSHQQAPSYGASSSSSSSYQQQPGGFRPMSADHARRSPATQPLQIPLMGGSSRTSSSSRSPAPPAPVAAVPIEDPNATMSI